MTTRRTCAGAAAVMARRRPAAGRRGAAVSPSTPEAVQSGCPRRQGGTDAGVGVAAETLPASLSTHPASALGRARASLPRSGSQVPTEEGDPMGTITVGQENSTPVELYYEDHGSG